MVYRLPPLSTLRVFEAAARHLSFKVAAEELLVTPSAVSRSLQVLEDWLGTPLFLRGNRTISLTEAGAAYLPHVRAALDGLARATADVPGHRSAGSLTLSAAPTFGLRWVMPRLGRFKAVHPDIRISIDTEHRQVDFLRDNIDIAIRMGRGEWPGTEAMHLVTEELIPVCAPALAHRLRKPEDLRHETLIHVTRTNTDWAFWCAAKGQDGMALDGGLRFDTIQYAFNAAKAGLGVALGRRPLMEEEIAAGDLVEVLGPPVSAPTGYWLVCSPSALNRPEVRAFRSWLQEELDQEPR